MDPTMAESREERMQQRLRGAQRRQVKDVDFGLTFPSAPIPSQQDVVPQESSLPELPVPLSSRTPGSVRGRGRPKAIPIEENTRPSQSVNDANTSAKRRKLSSEQSPAPSSSSRSTRSSLLAPKPDIYDLPEEEESHEVANAEDTGISMHQPIEHEIADGTETVLTISHSSNSKTRSSQGLESETRTQANSNVRESGLPVREALEEAAQRSLELQDGIHDMNDMDGETLSNVSPPVQKKRKRGVTTQKKLPPAEKRQRPSQTALEGTDIDNNVADNSSKVVRHLRPKSTPKSPPTIEEKADDQSTDEAEEIDDQEAAAILNKNQNRRVSRSAIDPPTKESPIVRKKKATKPSRPSISVQRLPKSQKPMSKKSSVKPSKKSRKQNTRLGSPIPITVHRMTENLYYEDDEIDADILNSEIPYINRGGVNTVDVLSQICEEIITSSLDMLHDLSTGADNSALKREYNTKWRAVETFGNELQTRLIEHTINLDNTYALEKRVRDEQRRKLALREDILRVRAEREQVALRMDDIRIKHENETQDAQKRDALNITIHDIEMAVELGKANAGNNGRGQMSGIELVLKRVASEVSNKSNTGGMLKQIKDFNAFLERTALALEMRKA